MLVLLFGIGTVFLAKTDVSITFPGGFTTALWKVGLLFALGVPGLLAAVVILWNVWRGHNPLKNVNFTAQTTSSTTTAETQRGPERGIREFLRVFGSAIRKALRTPERRLIIVLDNLDRIDAARTGDVWSTISAFLDAPGTIREVFERVWFIVPFDPEMRQETENTPTHNVSALEHKIFDAVFDVRDPVLVNWSSYFLAQLRTALPCHLNDEGLGDVYRLFAVTRHKQSPITPREINRFINAVGALHRQWCGEVPLLHQALFVAVPDLVQRRPLQIQKEKSLDEVTRIVGPVEDWQKSIFGLFFNVLPSEAEHAILAEDVTKALTAGATGQLRNLSNVHGFARVTNDVIAANAREWRRTAPFMLLKAAAALDEVTSDELAESWAVILRTIRPPYHWRLTRSTAEGAIAILRHAGTLHDEILTELVAAFRRADTTDGSGEWYGAWRLFYESERYRGDFDPIEVEGSPSFSIEILRYALIDETQSSFRIAASPSEIMEVFIGLFQDPEYASYLPVLKLLVAEHPLWPWEDLAARSIAIVDTGGEWRDVAAFATVANLVHLRGSTESVKTLRAWFETGSATLVWMNEIRTNLKLIATLARMLVWRGPLPRSITNVSRVEYEFARERFERAWNEPETSRDFVRHVSEAISRLNLAFVLDGAEDAPIVNAVRQELSRAR